MKNLKLLNKKYLSVVLFYLFFGLTAQSQEAIDIWNIEEKKAPESIDEIQNIEENDAAQNSIYKMQSQKDAELRIEEDLALEPSKIVGLYDPADNGLDINMWSK